MDRRSPFQPASLHLKLTVFHRGRWNAIHRRMDMSPGVSAGSHAPFVPRASHVQVQYRYSAARGDGHTTDGLAGIGHNPVPEHRGTRPKVGFPRLEASRANTQPKMSCAGKPYDSAWTAPGRACCVNPVQLGFEFGPEDRNSRPIAQPGTRAKAGAMNLADLMPGIPHWAYVQRTMGGSTMRPCAFE